MSKAGYWIVMDAARRKERDRKEAKEKLSLIMQQTQEDNERLAKNAYLTTARKTLYLAASPFAGQIGGLACIVMFYVELYVSLKNPHDALFTKNKKTLKSTRKAQFGKTVRNGDDKVPWKYYAFAMAPFVSLFSVFAACLGSWELTVDKKYAYLHKKRVPFLLLGAGGLAIEGWRFYAERQENDALILDAECSYRQSYMIRFGNIDDFWSRDGTSKEKELQTKLIKRILFRAQQAQSNVTRDTAVRTLYGACYLAISPFGGIILGTMSGAALVVACLSPHDKTLDDYLDESEGEKNSFDYSTRELSKVSGVGLEDDPYKQIVSPEQRREHALVAKASMIILFTACLRNNAMSLTQYSYIAKQRVPFFLLGAVGLALGHYSSRYEIERNDALILEAENVIKKLNE